MENVDEEKVDNLVQNIYDGLEITVKELQKTLPDQVDGMTVKQLRRSLKAVINYPEIDEDSVKVMAEREQRFTASMLALRQAGVQLEIKAIGELQRAHDEKQRQQGEE